MTNLAEELAEAERAVTGPRQQVAALQNDLTKAVGAGEFARAATLKDELAAALEVQAVTDARASALRDAAAQLERQKNAEAAKLAGAEERAAAEQALLDAQSEGALAKSRMGAELDEMRKCLAGARQHLQAAHAHQGAVTAARYHENDAKARLGYWPTDHPGPTVSRENGVTVLIERDPLIKVLGQGIG